MGRAGREGVGSRCRAGTMGVMATRHDYLLDMVERLGQALTVLVTGRASEAARPDENDPERAFQAEFEHVHPHLRRVDSRSAALLLRPPRRIRLYAVLLIQRAALRGDDIPATARRALELLLEAEAMEPGGELELLAALAGAVDLAALEPEHRARLRALGVVGRGAGGRAGSRRGKG